MAIINTGLTNTAANIYAAATNSAIVTIHLCNYSNSTQTVNVFVVPGGTIANTTNMIYSNLQITSYNTLIINSEKFILSTGDSIRANCANTSAVSATVSYIGI
jgi:hypothetical protein